MRAVLLDIEGTTTPMSFVFDVLFPYARSHLRRHLEQHASSPEHSVLFDRLRQEHLSDHAAGETVPPWVDTPLAARLASVANYIEWLMDRDRKSTSMKQLQGKIWEEGYRRGELVGAVFDDVPGALERWQRQDVQIGIFSSGSVLAQQLLFRNSSAGDLTRFVGWYFDTTVGTKTDSQSYRRIANTMRIPAGAILFISDSPRELDAARETGMQTMFSVRGGHQRAPEDRYALIRSFEELV